MSASALQRLYSSSPAFVQTLMLNVYALRLHKQRYGRKFERVDEELRATERFNHSEIEGYQTERLRTLVRHAFDTVPYYRDLFIKLGLTPEDIRSPRDLEKIPVLTREDVRREGLRLLSTTYRRGQLIPGRTSGTTGSPLQFFWDQRTCVYNNAVDWRQKRWAGVFPGDRIALFLGRMIVPMQVARPPFWRVDHVHSQAWFSSFHMSEENLLAYYEALCRYRPRAVEGYPSTLYILARFLLARGLRVPVRAAFTSSETLHAVQRAAIETAFQCRVFDFYGLAERVLFATECEAHAGRHVNFEYGILEVLDADHRRVPDDKMGTLVGTSLVNFGMPFIRYRTSDVSSVHSVSCPCGRAMPVLDEVTTKAEDIIVTPDGRLVSPSVLTHPFKPLKGIEKSQLVQEDLHTLVVKIVRRQTYTDVEESQLRDGLRERLGLGMHIVFQYVSEIPCTSSGKYRWVVSNVPATLWPGVA